MASDPPKPYQSRVFNTLSQKYRQFLDGCDRAGRQMRLTASRATQLLLYPIYVLVQGARVIGKQLKAQANKGLPQLKGFVKPEGGKVDKSIQDVLQTLTPTAPTVQVQGIASLLDNQQLVLVAAKTQTLYSLTQQQQWDLQRQITKALQPTQLKFPKIQLQSPIPSMGLILPVYCCLLQVMGWVQASPIALRMNLFGESALARVEHSQDENSATVISPQSSANPTVEPTAASALSSIQGLILAAIDYFLNQPTPELNGVQEQSQGILPQIESYGKPLFSLPAIEDQTPKLTSGIWQNLQQSSFPLFAGIGVGGFLVAATLGKYILEDEPQEIQNVYWATPFHFSYAPQQLTKEQEYGSKSSFLPIRYNTAAVEPADSEQIPDYLETPVTAVEYVKHPLVKVLEWLDRVVFWVEESLLKLRDWIAAKIN